jgi:hypothetical protein
MVSRSIKRPPNARMQAFLKQLMSCIGLSKSAETALYHDIDSDLEALLEDPRKCVPPERSYCDSSVSTTLKSLHVEPTSKAEDAC